MTQPTSVNMTFDTSLVDLNTSFSTTESDPSDAGFQPSILKTPEPQQSPFNNSNETPKQSQPAPSLTPTTNAIPPKPTTPVQHIGTQAAYNQWAAIYDKDGNMLQSIDDLELTSLLPDFLAAIAPATSSSHLHMLDLGCGTGRNTAKLLEHAYAADQQVDITALDFSQGMLDVAAAKLDAVLSGSGSRKPTLRLEQADCFPTVQDARASPLPPVAGLAVMDAVLSSLVLEHIPLAPFFATLAALLRPGGCALVTNMHSEMGRISQAGFVNEDGVKVRGTSFAHSPEETVEEAGRAGFEVVRLEERRMERGDVESGRVGERGGKWVGIHVWYAVVLRKL